VKKEVFYLGQYSPVQNPRNLKVFPSAITKMDYIKSALKRANIKVKIISLAETSNITFCYFSRKHIEVDELESVSYINTFGGPTVVMKLFSRTWTLIQLLHFLLFRIKETDKLLVYHTLVYSWPIKIARSLRNMNIYFEVEELYHAVRKSSEYKRRREKQYLAKASGYILVNDLIAESCGFINKPIAVCYGDYRYYVRNLKRTDDGYIHLVYAGLIDSDGGDVSLAVDTMTYLPDKYILHVLGYGQPKSIQLLNARINSINLRLQRKAILYHGCLTGEDYYYLLSNCDFGLCPRALPDEQSDYTFPSKVLVYLGCRLTPVCTPIAAVMHSTVSNFVVFSKGFDAESIADCLLSPTQISAPDPVELLSKMDKDFTKSLPSLFNLCKE